MIRGIGIVVVLTSTMLLGGCLAVGVPVLIIANKAPSIEGQWASGDGISATSFQGGQFATRYVKTNELLAQGSYSASGKNIAMQWVSFRDHQNKSATCSFVNKTKMHCTQEGGSGFDLNRTG